MAFKQPRSAWNDGYKCGQCKHFGECKLPSNKCASEKGEYCHYRPNRFSPSDATIKQSLLLYCDYVATTTPSIT